MPQLKPILNNILVRELQPARVGLIHIPETAERRYFYGTILGIGKDVEPTLSPGTVCVFQKNSLKKTKYGSVFKDTDVLMVYFRGAWHPFGFRALVKRHIEETKIGSIIIPSCYKSADQSLDCHLIRLGVMNNRIIDYPLSCGDNLKIKGWDALIHEIDLGNKAYGLSIPIEMLQYRRENA